MNILILTGRFGMGHYSAANAIKEEIESCYSDMKIDIVDIVEYLVPETSKYVYGSFEVLVSKFANLYNLFNKAMRQKCVVPLKGKFISKLDKLIDKYSPEIIISTLPISSQYISAYKMLKKINIPLITYITDISWHDEWIAQNTNYYFVGSIKVKEELIKKGIGKEKIKVSGIPVKSKFKINKEVHNNSLKKNLLIMGGGLGLIELDNELFKRLNNEENIKTTVIAGNNKKMYHFIKENYKNLDVVGYVNNVDQYMKKADLVVSKAGGITLYEAIYSEVPIYVVKPFLIQEVNNAKYIEDECIGRVVWNKEEDIVENIISVLSDNKEIINMRRNMKNIKESFDINSINLIVGNYRKGA
ncbi:Processive diacylglycerol glucosyltransferase [uncultured Clostridium sp.]|uniref:MGDG synthase family glycosyltransferase n=1 Tax=uncultured Clostridium sp. TaxID=59620 RepID=UPI0008225E99|nr:glycosyltransferase [uncultured Clostridium sp.]SCJ02353.1 Processive diacylglycerol glucosyltransferase [uncultured Clostridium sp.]